MSSAEIKTTKATTDIAKQASTTGDDHPVELVEEVPSVSAYRRKGRKMVTATNPIGSKGPTCLFRYSFWMMAVTSIPAIPMGTLTSKIRGQLNRSTKYPPISGPKETDDAEAIDQNPNA